MVEVIAETQRLLLRTEAAGDQAVWLKHMNCAQVMEHLGGPRTAEKVAESFARMADGWAQHGFSFMLVERKSDGMLIGHCGLTKIDTHAAPDALNGQIQIGWTLRPDCWGQGYAQEAAQTVLDMAFTRYRARRLFGQTSQSNEASWRLMKKLGMTRRASLDYSDPDYPPQDNPTIIYAMTHDAWRARQKRTWRNERAPHPVSQWQDAENP
jgi:RimJ/RimL family protein N-acetyltransferase